ncbi:MAG: Hsp20/alpha crystallin family protein [Lentisphaerae bacterium]|nr:Hsp20/alpha crystallin family protein [Lentisphaerota bacterium]
MFWPEFSESNSLSELRRIQNEVNRLFGEYEGAGESFPAVNIWTNKDGAVLKAEIPGVDPADIAVSVQDEQVDISGERKQDPVSDEMVCHRAERGFGKFARSFTLPFAVEKDKVSAGYKNGVLMVTLPRAEAAKPKQIKVLAE